MADEDRELANQLRVHLVKLKSTKKIGRKTKKEIDKMAEKERKFANRLRDRSVKLKSMIK